MFDHSLGCKISEKPAKHVSAQQEEVLMVQEAKHDCYKEWYLPAGRVEVGETLEEALKREVR